MPSWQTVAVLLWNLYLKLLTSPTDETVQSKHESRVTAGLQFQPALDNLQKQNGVCVQVEVMDPHKLLSWLGSSGASFLCRGDVEEASLVGEGEALEDESLLPPSEPEERWGTGGALFLPRKLPSSTPFFLPPPSALSPSATPSPSCWRKTFLLTSPPGVGLSGGCRWNSSAALVRAPILVAELELAALHVRNSIATLLLSLSSSPNSQRERRASGARLEPGVDAWPALSSIPRLRLKFWKSLKGQNGASHR